MRYFGLERNLNMRRDTTDTIMTWNRLPRMRVLAVTTAAIFSVSCTDRGHNEGEAGSFDSSQAGGFTGDAGSSGAPSTNGGAGGTDIGSGGTVNADAATSAAAGRDYSSAGNGGPQGAAGQNAPVIPTERNGRYVFEFDELTFEIDPQIGGRIRTFALAGQNVLTGPEVDADNWGSTFWPSPQQRWNWPPVPELDSQPYQVSIADDTLVLKSQPGTRAKVSVEKRVRAVRERAAIDIEYVLTNTDSAIASWAPWEISRVAASGLTFFPTGSATVTANLPVTNKDEMTFYQHDPKAFNGSGQKYTADGSGGWLAHVSGKLLFLKTLADVTPALQAPAPEAEIEIYAAAKYVELEPQGPYVQLQPNQSTRWTVRWYLRRLPDSAAAEPGNAALLRFVRSITNP